MRCPAPLESPSCGALFVQLDDFLGKVKHLEVFRWHRFTRACRRSFSQARKCQENTPADSAPPSTRRGHFALSAWFILEAVGSKKLITFCAVHYLGVLSRARYQCQETFGSLNLDASRLQNGWRSCLISAGHYSLINELMMTGWGPCQLARVRRPEPPKQGSAPRKDSVLVSPA
jgi:hypothetical protein